MAEENSIENRSRFGRRSLLQAGLAAAGLAIFGRGSWQTAVDIKRGVEKSVRSFKSLGRFFYKEPRAVQLEPEPVRVEPVKVKPLTEFYTIFHDLPRPELEKAIFLVRQMHGVIAQNPEYKKGTLYEVTKKHEDLIRKAAIDAGIHPNLAIGIIFVENGGGEAVRNRNSGAVGIAQLMPETARRYGLKVTPTSDERENPEKSILAMGAYLADLKKEFLDEGLAIWAYHAGEGNVYDALRSYFKNVDGADYGDVVGTENSTIAEKYRRLILERKLTVHQVLANPAVQKEVVSQLTDETELYVYKVIAAAQLFQVNKETFG